VRPGLVVGASRAASAASAPPRTRDDVLTFHSRCPSHQGILITRTTALDVVCGDVSTIRELDASSPSSSVIRYARSARATGS